MTRILILGADGYLGWPTCMYLANQGHDVYAIDNFAKRRWEAEMGVAPLISPLPFTMRAKIWNDKFQTDHPIKTKVLDIVNSPNELYEYLDKTQPEAIVHYAEQPSAPYSQATRRSAVTTQTGNITGTLNLIFACLHTKQTPHIIKLGSMGEYGTPNIPIKEGWLDVSVRPRGSLIPRRDRILYPKRPGSFYHLSKVHDSNNLEFACRVYGLSVTDLNQGVVYGISTNETLLHEDLRTSFHYDAIFGTVINRFCAQAASRRPLTVYGTGGQTRGFLNIRDTLRCVELAIENPADSGDFRVFNQFTETFSVQQLAERVRRALGRYRIDVSIEHTDNPRVEEESHFYEAENSGLHDLGLSATKLSDGVLEEMVDVCLGRVGNIRVDTMDPGIRWKVDG